MSDQPASLLTNKQRKYLQGKAEPSNVSQTEGRMYERIERGLFDFYILFEYLNDEQLENVFGTRTGKHIERHKELQGDTPDQPAAAAYTELAMAFFLRGLNYGDEDIYAGLEESTGEPQPAFKHFIENVEKGIQRYLRDEKQRNADVTVNIELDNIRPSDEFIKDLEDSE